MRDELVRAAKATPGALSTAILKADRSVKRPVFGRWTVIRTEKKHGRRSR